MSRPARYTRNDADESDAITVLRMLLRGESVKHHLTEGDKRPNIDGTIEILDEQKTSIGTVEVQVRKIPKGRKFYPCPRKLVDYAEQSTLNPVILICVDIANDKAFWRDVASLQPQFKPGRKTLRVKFDPDVEAIGRGKPYLTGWRGIVAGYQNQRSEFPTLKRRFAEEAYLSSIPKPEIVYFQTFIEAVNELLDIDFAVIKRQFFADVWKLGVGIHAPTPKRLYFQIYSIRKGETARRVSSFVEKTLEGFLDPDSTNFVSASMQGSGSTIQKLWVDRAHLNDPETEARNFVLWYVREMLEKKLFQVAGKFLSKEYLFWFLGRYHRCAGLPLANSYDIASVNYAVKVFMPAWYFLAERRYFEINKDRIRPGVFPSFESIAGMGTRDGRPTPGEVGALLKSGRGIPPAFFSTQFFSSRALTQSLDYLLTSGEQSIGPIYKPRTRIPAWLWDGYTLEDVRHNVTTILTNAVHEYGLFVQFNSLNRIKSEYLHDNMALVHVGDVSKWNRRDQIPRLESYLVENTDRRLNKVTFIDESLMHVPFQATRERLSVGETERKVVWSRGWLATDLFDDFPMQSLVYSMLKSDLSDHYGFV